MQEVLPQVGAPLAEWNKSSCPEDGTLKIRTDKTTMNKQKALAVLTLAALAVVGAAPFLASAQSVPQINSSTATTVATPMVQALIDILTWFWTNLGTTLMWLAFIGLVVYAIYRRVHYGKVF